jgi:hypothetical protein
LLIDRVAGSLLNYDPGVVASARDKTGLAWAELLTGSKDRGRFLDLTAKDHTEQANRIVAASAEARGLYEPGANGANCGPN